MVVGNKRNSGNIKFKSTDRNKNKRRYSSSSKYNIERSLAARPDDKKRQNKQGYVGICIGNQVYARCGDNPVTLYIFKALFPDQRVNKASDITHE